MSNKDLQTYYVAETLKHDGKVYSIGSEVELTPAQAAQAGTAISTEPIKTPEPVGAGDRYDANKAEKARQSGRKPGPRTEETDEPNTSNEDGDDEDQGDGDEQTGDELDGMTVEQLRAVAAERNISLEGVTLKADIIDTIRNAGNDEGNTEGDQGNDDSDNL